MKRAVLLFLLIIAFIGAKAQDEPQKTLPPDLDMLTIFYKGYIAAYNDGSPPSSLTRKQAQMRRAYCTPRAEERYWELMQKAEDDSDMFIKSPGANREAMSTLQAAKVPNQPGRYKVSYQANENDKITIELALINDKGEWKIDYLY